MSCPGPAPAARLVASDQGPRLNTTPWPHHGDSNRAHATRDRNHDGLRSSEFTDERQIIGFRRPLFGEGLIFCNRTTAMSPVASNLACASGGALIMLFRMPILYVAAILVATSMLTAQQSDPTLTREGVLLAVDRLLEQRWFPAGSVSFSAENRTTRFCNGRSSPRTSSSRRRRAQSRPVRESVRRAQIDSVSSDDDPFVRCEAADALVAALSASKGADVEPAMQALRVAYVPPQTSARRTVAVGHSDRPATTASMHWYGHYTPADAKSCSMASFRRCLSKLFALICRTCRDTPIWTNSRTTATGSRCGSPAISAR